MNPSPDFSPEQLEACLLQLTHPDTNEIKHAEAALKAYLKKLVSVVGLMTQLQHSQKPEVRQLAALMLRKKMIKHWPKLDEATRIMVKQTLLNRAAEDPVKIVRFNICAVVALLSLHEVPAGKWPELMVFIYTCAKSGNENHREVSMRLLQLLGESMGPHLQPHFNDLKELFAATLQDATSLKVRVASMRAACSLIEFLEKSDLREFQTLIPLMVEVLHQCIVNGHESEAMEFMDVFSEIASKPFPLLDRGFPNFIELLLQIFLHDKLEASTRASASYTLSEFLKMKPKTLGKMELVGKVFGTMLDVIANDDSVSCGLITSLLEKDSASSEEDGDDEDESPGHLAQQTIDTLALSIPAKYVDNVVFAQCQEYIQSPETRKRKAGVLALGILSEGCCEFMVKNLEQLLAAAFQSAQDPEQRVREAACFSLGQFAEFLQPEINEHYNQILQVAIVLLDDPAQTIRAAALYVLDEITQTIESHQVLPYLDTLVTKLVNVLRTSTPQMQKMALDAISSIAIGAKEAFMPYFKSVVELVQPFWSISDPKFYFLRGAAMECLGYLASAMGKEAYAEYLAPSMPFVFAVFELSDSELKEQAFSYIINVSGVYKEDFGPFLEQAATHVFNELENDEGIRLVDDEDEALNGFDSEDEEEGDDGVMRHISIRTDALNSKVRAIACVEELALNCGSLFEPFIPKFLEGLAPLSEYIHEDVRAAVAEALAALVICSFDASHPGTVDTQVWVKGDFNAQLLTPNNKLLMEAVMKCLVEELVTDVEEVVVEKAFAAIKVMSARMGPLVTMDHMARLIEISKTILAYEHDCQSAHEEDEEETREGGSVLESVVELLGVLAKCYGDQFLAPFQEVFPALLSFANELRSVNDRAAVVGCFAEVLREINPATALQFVESVLGVSIQGVTSDNMVLRANAAFCLGVLAEVSGDQLKGAYESMLRALRPLFEADANDDVVVDNACAAVARMILANLDAVPLEAVLPVFLSNLPLKVDMDEMPVVFKCLNGLMQAQNPQAMQLMPSILEVYAKSLGAESKVPEPVQMEIKACVRGLLVSFEAQIRGVIAQLTPEQQEALAKALQ